MLGTAVLTMVASSCSMNSAVATTHGRYRLADDVSIIGSALEVARHFQYKPVHATVRVLDAAVRVVLQLEAGFPLVIEDVAGADMVAKLECGRQAFVVVVIQVREQRHT